MVPQYSIALQKELYKLQQEDYLGEKMSGRGTVVSLLFILLLSCLNVFYIPLASAQSGTPPEPYITAPSNDEFLYSLPPMVKVGGDWVEIRAVDLSEEGDVIAAVFEYSPNLLDWYTIGIDEDPGFEGVQFDGDGGVNSTNGWGDTGWNSLWNTEVLEDGFYFLRVTMFDGQGLSGIDEIPIHFDRTPPAFDITYSESFGMDVLGPVDGVLDLGISGEDEDPIALLLEYLNASRPYYNQEGLGDADQRDVGRTDDKGTFENTDDVNNFCGPASAANALWRLAQNDPSLLSDGKGGNFSSAAEMGKKLANDTNTSVTNGTATDDMTDGLRKFLKDRGQDGNYSVRAHIPDNRGGGRPTWSDVANALRQGEAVILLKVKPGADGVVGTRDDRGHYETGKDAFPTWSERGGGKVSVTDPLGPADKNGTVKAVPKNNGFEGIWFDEDGDGKVGPCEVWYLFAFWEVSPNNPRTWSIHRVQYVMAANDTERTDGLSVPFNTSGMHDGFYLFRMTMVDGTGNFGMNRTTVYVNNRLPAQASINVDDVTTNSVRISWSMNMDEDFFSYTVYASPANGSLGESAFNSKDWGSTSTTITGLQFGKDYFFTVATEDQAGGVAYSVQKWVKTSAPAPVVDSFAVAAVILIAAAAVASAALLLKRRRG